jgi:hypothetical protein
MVLAAAFIPPNGTAVVDTFPGLIGWYGRRNARRNKQKGHPGTLPTAWAMLAFCNGMTREQREFTVGRFYPESPSIALENVDRTEMPDAIPRTWILTTRDRAIPVKSQHRGIEAIGGVQTMIPMATCHDLMISEPRRLAEILVERCLAYQ